MNDDGSEKAALEPLVSSASDDGTALNEPNGVATSADGAKQLSELDESKQLSNSESEGDSQYAPRMKYTLAYEEFESVFKRETVDNLEALNPKLDLQHDGQEAVLEVVRTIHAKEVWNHSNDETTIKIQRYGLYELKINSPAIIQALAGAIDYWPDLDLSKSCLEIEEPFAALYQCRDSLAEFSKSNDSPQPGESDNVCQRYKDSSSHVKLLLDFLEARPEAKKIALERERHQRATPVATYNMLWMLFAPGTDVYYDAEGYGFFAGYVVKEAYGGGLDVDDTSVFNFTLRSLDFDGFELGRREESVFIQPFRGEREIDSLKVIPCDFYGRNEAGQISEKSKDLRNQLISNGEKFLSLTKRQCAFYSGQLHQALTRHVSLGKIVSFYLSV